MSMMRASAWLVSRFQRYGARMPAATAAAVATCTATAVTGPWLFADNATAYAAASTGTGTNRPLAERHRVALCGWPIKGARQSSDPRVATLRLLFDHCRQAGYDGIEMGCDDLKEMGFFAWNTPNSEVAAVVKREAVAARFPSTNRGPSTGVLYKVTDGNPAPFPGCLDFAHPRFEEAFAEKLRDDQALGAEYVSFQIFLPPHYLNSAGAYRDDPAYLQLCAKRIAMLYRVAGNIGMNCYVRRSSSKDSCPCPIDVQSDRPLLSADKFAAVRVLIIQIETHIDRISEDLQAFCKILDLCELEGTSVELNGDLSHYYYRGISQGSYLPRVLRKVGHMHQRMCREHGDLSANVLNDEPLADWDAKGVTWQAFEYAKPALAGGLSSRMIMGETGPMHLVKDALGLDAKLVPLWRAMARYADAEIGVDIGRNSGPSTTGVPRQGVELSLAEADKILARHFASAR